MKVFLILFVAFAIPESAGDATLYLHGASLTGISWWDLSCWAAICWSYRAMIS